MDQRGTTTSDRGCNSLYNEMSPDIILDHIPVAGGDLLVQSRGRERNWSVHLLEFVYGEASFSSKKEPAGPRTCAFRYYKCTH